MKKFTRIIALLMVALLTVGLASCSSKTTLADIQEKGVVVMATNAEFEPFEYMEGDTVVGIDADIAAKIAEKMGVKLEIMNMEFDSIIASVKSGKADFGAAGMTIDEKRLKSVDFSDTYFSASQVIIVNIGSEIKSAADLANKKIGVQAGTTGDKYCTEEVEGAEVSPFNKGADAVQALMAGKIDAVVIDDFPATKYVEKNADKIVKLEEPLTNEEYAICVSKGNTEIVDAINEVLKELKDSGELDAIVSNYITAD